MSPTDPIQAAHEAKHATTLLRESRAIQRRLDKLALTAAAARPPTTQLISDRRDAMERLVHHLMREEKAQHRRAAQSLRGGH
jgi:hypothetical protein